VTLNSLGRFLSSTVTRRVELRERTNQHPWTQVRGFDPDNVVLVPAASESCPNGARMNLQEGLCYSWIPEGSVFIGCPRDCGPLDQDRKQFTLKAGFFLTQTEVTVGHIASTLKTITTRCPNLAMSTRTGKMRQTYRQPQMGRSEFLLSPSRRQIAH